VGLERVAAWAGGGGWPLCSKAVDGGATRRFSGRGEGQNGVAARSSSSLRGYCGPKIHQALTL
jgi:hypothetical protein